MFTGPVGPVEVFFYWPKAVLGNFYWPGAIGSPLASSPGYHIILFCNRYLTKEKTVYTRFQRTETSKESNFAGKV